MKLQLTVQVKRKLWMFFGCLLLLWVGSAAIGQTSRDLTVARIPFAFSVGNQDLPAGSYTIIRMGDSNLRLTDAQHKCVIVAAHRMLGNPPESRGRLVFHRYRNVTFLAEVWFAGEGTGNAVLPSRREEALDRGGSQRGFTLLEFPVRQSQNRAGSE